MHRISTPRTALAAVLNLVVLGAVATAPPYTNDVSKWVEVKVPSRRSDSGNWAVWFFSANYSKHEWLVYLVDGKPHAKLIPWAPRPSEEEPAFRTFNKKFGDGYAFQRVSDGWLVGFNMGEWGGTLYWYNHDGTESYQISPDQVVAFFRLPGGFYAIEGCGHMGLDDGTVIRIARSGPEGKWRAETVAELPDSPDTVCVRTDGKAVIVGADTLLVFEPDKKVRTLVADAPWMYANSSVLTPDERKLYIGMREYVAEFDFATRKLRMLVPSQAFRNRLPKEREDAFRRIYAPLKRKKK